MDRLISGLSWFLVAFLLIAMAAFAYAAFTVYSVTDFRQAAAEQRELLRGHAETALAAAAGDRGAITALRSEAQRIESGFDALADGVPLLSDPELTAILHALRADWNALAPQREQLIVSEPTLEPLGALSGQRAVLMRMESLAEGLRSARRVSDPAGAEAASQLQIALMKLRLALTQARSPGPETARILAASAAETRDALEGLVYPDSVASINATTRDANDLLQALRAHYLEIRLSLLAVADSARDLAEIASVAAALEEAVPQFDQHLVSLDTAALEQLKQQAPAWALGAGSAALSLLTLMLLLFASWRRSARAAAQLDSEREDCLQLASELEDMRFNLGARLAPRSGHTEPVIHAVNGLMDTWRRELLPLRPLAENAQGAAYRSRAELERIHAGHTKCHRELVTQIAPLNTLSAEAKDLERLAQRCAAAAQRERMKPSLMYEKIERVAGVLAERLSKQSEVLEACARRAQLALQELRPEAPSMTADLSNAADSLRTLAERLPLTPTSVSRTTSHIEMDGTGS